ncbi:pyridoxamine 5'-phosphate oxidase family protein [Pseudonocardia halophobica]|uniref:pyridoxamine 5'-phosphate oxidase family protein n=1 Tax=Pseudonocardia halophobica TaxID=29401 RepID=UPI003D8A9C13
MDRVVSPPDAPVSATGHTAGFVTIGRAECLLLLDTVDVGRVVYTENALPAAHPVTFLRDGEEIIFRTGSPVKAAAAAKRAVVGFQADRIQPDRGCWSVLGIGTTYEITEPTRLADLDHRLPRPWLPDHDGFVLAIALRLLTGRHVAAL